MTPTNLPDSLPADYPALCELIITAGQAAGLVLDDDPDRNARLIENPDYAWLTRPVRFSLRPVADYHRNFRGSWTEMIIKPVSVGEGGPNGDGVGLVFETTVSLAHQESYDALAPAEVIADLMARLEDFAASHPAEAALILTEPCRFEMHLEGEIIYIPAEDEGPFPDISLYPALELGVEVMEVGDVAAFEQALAGLTGAGSPLSEAIEAAMSRLALLLRWLDTEAEPRPPRLDLDWMEL